MKIKLNYLVYLVFLAFLNCTTHVALDLAPYFFGKIYDENGNIIDSAIVEVIDIDATGHESIEDFVGKICYSDEYGEYLLNLPGGVEFEKKIISGKKKYTKYVENVKIKVSKTLFKDTLVILHNNDYEESCVEKDVILKSY